ncbi:group-specific protein [Paenibacillus oryzae]|uniref:Group-specific protein n=1 Tax=Paenibacillus oryzae TaxID=1844972 RepID=A0A1A5YTP4_9BACL|nr:group-specific protein [Paenibacillus oryzae]OBR68924.1 group-specific protein [Paenibacillus oryzae]
MKKFYIASSLKNVANVKYVSDQLKEMGFIHSYDWTQNDKVTSIDQMRDIGRKEMTAVKKSNFIVVLLPAGKGSHIELGIALGNSIKIYLYSPNDEINDIEKTSTFYHQDGIHKCKGTLEELIQYIWNDQKSVEG